MEALVAIFSIFYILWPLITLFGIRPFFSKTLSFKERLLTGISHVFMAWSIWAFFLGFIYWQGRKPVLFMSENVNHLSFLSLGVFSSGITIIWMVKRWKERRVRLSDAKKLDDLMALSPNAFESLVAKLFQAYGHRAEVAGGTSDHGVDIVIHTGQGEKWIAQCKRYSGSVGEPVVRDLFGTLGHEEAQRAYLITTGNFTRQAIDWAEGKPIILYDGEGLITLIRRTQKKPSKQRI